MKILDEAIEDLYYLRRLADKVECVDSVISEDMARRTERCIRKIRAVNEKTKGIANLVAETLDTWIEK